MPEPMVIAVFGVTGHQGGAVARALARDPNFKVRGITRNIQDDKIEALKESGVVVLSCNLDDVDSIRMALNHTDGCFVVTYTDFSEPDCIAKEKSRGRNIVDACVKANVPHVIYSTQMHTTRVTGVEARHLVAKAENEEYLKTELQRKCRAVPRKSIVTSLLIPCYYENFFDYLKPRRLHDNNFVLEIPMGTTPLDLVSVEDIGQVAKNVFLNPDQYDDKTLSLCGAKLTIKEIAAELSRLLQPLCFRDRPVTIVEYGQFGYPWSIDFANMFNFFLRKDQQYSVEKSRQMNPELQTFRDWVQRNAARLKAAFDKL